MARFEPADITGQKFERWTAIRPTGEKTKNGSHYWLCECECGNVGKVTVSNLRYGNSKSCGCIPKDRMSKLNYKHGGRNERLYGVWMLMRRRCNDPHMIEYENYGGRGIKVCDDWNDYAAFREWALKAGYDETAKIQECTIDRIDVNGNYCPENCRWASCVVQQNNRRNNIRIMYNGETHTAAEWNRILSFPKGTVIKIISSGWSIERALETPIDYSHHPGKREAI